MCFRKQAQVRWGTDLLQVVHLSQLKVLIQQSQAGLDLVVTGAVSSLHQTEAS